MGPSPGLAFVTVVGTLAYLGLAILGAGGFAAFFSHPARVVLAVIGFVLAGRALFSAGNLSPGEREDRGNRWVIAAFGLGPVDGHREAMTVAARWMAAA